MTHHPQFYHGWRPVKPTSAAESDIERMARTLFGYPQPVDDRGPEAHPDSDEDLRGAEIDKVLDRNWNELLQELRVAETGTQILTGFLLTLPFTNRFATLSHGQERLYLAVLIGSVVATGLNVAPVAYHRILFRRRKRRWLVSAANLLARAALLMLALDSAGVVLLVFDVVVDRTAALVAGGAVLVFLLGLWGVVPLVERASHAEGGHAAEARRSPGSTSEP